MSDYTPRPGSAAEHALDFIRKNGGSARSKEIAAEIGIEAKNVCGSLAAAVENGVLVVCDVVTPGGTPQKEYRLSGGGKPMTWREPKPARAATSATDKPAQEAAKPARKPRKPAKPAKPHPRGTSRTKATGRLLRAAAKGRQKTAKTLPVVEVPWKAEHPKDASCGAQPGCDFRCGVFSDGSLVLRLRDGSLAELPPDDTRALLDYLDRSLLREAA
jgi:hypothetical protein